LPATKLLSRTIALTQQFVRNAPLTFTGNSDPAFSNADWVRQFILAPPFAWPWNRAKAKFTCIIGQQDYSIAVATFGFIEKGVVSDPTNGDQTHELEVEVDIAEETVPNLPTRVSAQMDDDNGNITFRLIPPPDKAYAIELTLQNAAPTFVALTDTWAPIPDKLSYLYDQGMLAKAYEYLNDSRFPTAMQLFMRQVLAANTGLSDTQKNIFLEENINTQRDSQGQLAASQQGRQGRGAF
jgi:hypothetical protein